MPAGQLLLRQSICLQMPTRQLRDPQLPVIQVQPTRWRRATAAASADREGSRRALLPLGQSLLRQLFRLQLPTLQVRDPQLPVTQVQPTRSCGATAASSANRARCRRVPLPGGSLLRRQLTCLLGQRDNCATRNCRSPKCHRRDSAARRLQPALIESGEGARSCRGSVAAAPIVLLATANATTAGPAIAGHPSAANAIAPRDGCSQR